MSTKKSLEKLNNVLNSGSSRSPVVRPSCFPAVSRFQSLVGELRSHRLHRVKIWEGELNRDENTAYTQRGGSRKQCLELYSVNTRIKQEDLNQPLKLPL